MSPKQKRPEALFVRISTDLKEWIKEQAEKDGRSVSAWVARRLWEYRELSRKDEVENE